MSLHPLGEFAAYHETAGLVELSVAGSEALAGLNGPWWYNSGSEYDEDSMPGVKNGKPVFTNGSYFLYWDGIDTWEISESIGLATPDPILFSRTDPNYIGQYESESVEDHLVTSRGPLYLRQYWGSVAQTVMYIPAFAAQGRKDAKGFAEFPIQICHLYPIGKDRGTKFIVDDVVEQRAMSDCLYYEALRCSTSGAPGIQMTGWRAQQVRAEYQGIIDHIEATSGSLVKSATTVTLVNLTRT